MGVKGLWKLLEPFAEPTSIDEWRGARVAIDASVWVSQMRAVAHKRRGGRQDAMDIDTSGIGSGGAGGGHAGMTEDELISVLEGFVRRILKLWWYDITPVFVFDGPAPMVKVREQARRAAQRARNEEERLGKVAMQILRAQLAHEELRREQNEHYEHYGGEQHEEEQHEEEQQEAQQQRADGIASASGKRLSIDERLKAAKEHSTRMMMMTMDAGRRRPNRRRRGAGGKRKRGSATGGRLRNHDDDDDGAGQSSPSSGSSEDEDGDEDGGTNSDSDASSCSSDDAVVVSEAHRRAVMERARAMRDALRRQLALQNANGYYDEDDDGAFMFDDDATSAQGRGGVNTSTYSAAALAKRQDDHAKAFIAQERLRLDAQHAIDDGRRGNMLLATATATRVGAVAANGSNSGDGAAPLGLGLGLGAVSSAATAASAFMGSRGALEGSTNHQQLQQQQHHHDDGGAAAAAVVGSGRCRPPPSVGHHPQPRGLAEGASTTGGKGVLVMGAPSLPSSALPIGADGECSGFMGCVGRGGADSAGPFTAPPPPSTAAAAAAAVAAERGIGAAVERGRDVVLVGGGSSDDDDSVQCIPLEQQQQCCSVMVPMAKSVEGGVVVGTSSSASHLEAMLCHGAGRGLAIDYVDFDDVVVGGVVGLGGDAHAHDSDDSFSFDVAEGVGMGKVTGTLVRPALAATGLFAAPPQTLVPHSRSTAGVEAPKAPAAEGSRGAAAVVILSSSSSDNDDTNSDCAEEDLPIPSGNVKRGRVPSSVSAALPSLHPPPNIDAPCLPPIAIGSRCAEPIAASPLSSLGLPMYTPAESVIPLRFEVPKPLPPIPSATACVNTSGSGDSAAAGLGGASATANAMYQEVPTGLSELGALLRLLGVEYIVAPSEADEQCAYLSRLGGGGGGGGGVGERGQSSRGGTEHSCDVVGGGTHVNGSSIITMLRRQQQQQQRNEEEEEAHPPQEGRDEGASIDTAAPASDHLSSRCMPTQRSGGSRPLGVDAVFTEDSDIVVRGASCVLRGFFGSNASAVKCYRRARLSAAGLTPMALKGLAMLMGCDYCEGVKGVGGSHRTALRVLATLWQRPHTIISSPPHHRPPPVAASSARVACNAPATAPPHESSAAVDTTAQIPDEGQAMSVDGGCDTGGDGDATRRGDVVPPPCLGMDMAQQQALLHLEASALWLMLEDMLVLQQRIVLAASSQGSVGGSTVGRGHRDGGMLDCAGPPRSSGLFPLLVSEDRHSLLQHSLANRWRRYLCRGVVSGSSNPRQQNPNPKGTGLWQGGGGGFPTVSALLAFYNAPVRDLPYPVYVAQRSDAGSGGNAALMGDDGRQMEVYRFLLVRGVSDGLLVQLRSLFAHKRHQLAGGPSANSSAGSASCNRRTALHEGGGVRWNVGRADGDGAADRHITALTVPSSCPYECELRMLRNVQGDYRE